jgi:hypothetical protein
MKTILNNVKIVFQNNRARVNVPLDYISSGTLKVGSNYDLILSEKKEEDLIIKRMVKKGPIYEIEFINGDIIKVPFERK